MPLLFQLSQFPWQLTPHSFLSPRPLDLNVLVIFSLKTLNEAMSSN